MDRQRGSIEGLLCGELDLNGSLALPHPPPVKFDQYIMRISLMQGGETPLGARIAGRQ